MFLFISSVPSCLILMLLFPKNRSVCFEIESCWEAKVDLPPSTKFASSQRWRCVRNGSINGTRYTSHTEQGWGLLSELSNSLASPAGKGRCADFIFSVKLLSVSERHPFHTCQNVFGLENHSQDVQSCIKDTGAGSNVVK